ncbi:RimK family alpha-L-glutamate ligase [Undibacterium sp.]|jgi:glutathione synthase/RimK-type ligase-like ATP-grasp enzyme|uniref:ATP-grasp domain-containing protein n=1 Tax=Undibacterium sp. TaxID=1914977 RepID=UPI002C7668D3|nr:RimK family alpha-L-glutamate ligase [Undibacterium sp.]HTD03235.1 RimK family alpha-L-glutamate ligase [Undibacterium sp.]
MNPSEPVSRTEKSDERFPLMGLALLMTMICSGLDLTGLAKQLLGRIMCAPTDANALLDLSIISQLWFKRDIGLAFQAQALNIQQLYHLRTQGAPTLRLLAIMAEGDLAANTPLEFLVEGSDISLDLLYLGSHRPVPSDLPAHDLVFVAVGESDRNRAVLHSMDSILKASAKPVVNLPRHIARLARDSVSRLLQLLPGVASPVSARVTRQELQQAADDLPVSAILADGNFPLIVRPVDSHAGQGLMKLDDRAAVAAYLNIQHESEFYASRFIDYRSRDGLFRKYRVVLIDGKAFACHMAISDRWMIHYLNAGMSSSAEKRFEEAEFMANFDVNFGRRHGTALQAIGAQFGLEYLVIDCAESVDGKLLIFEVDSAAVVHAMDPADVFPYKQAQMQKIFDAFRHMLMEKAGLGSKNPDPRQ